MSGSHIDNDPISEPAPQQACSNEAYDILMPLREQSRLGQTREENQEEVEVLIRIEDHQTTT